MLGVKTKHVHQINISLPPSLRFLRLGQLLSNFFEALPLHGHHSGLHVVDKDVHRQYSLYDSHELQRDVHSQAHGYDREDVFYYIH